MIEQFAQLLADRIRAGLPGMLAHARMAPLTRPVREFQPEDYPEARIGSVLLLVYPIRNGLYLALIKRPDYEGVHSGQISFPGGKWEPGDADYYATALRETEEEIGVPAASIQFIGNLSKVYIPPSNFFVHPFIACASETPVFNPDVREVQEVIHFPIQVLMQDAAKSTMRIQRGDLDFEVPCYVFESYQIWGATAIMLSELELLLQEDTSLFFSHENLLH